MNDFVPTREDRFSFGLWTVGWQGVDVFGGTVRPPMPPADAVHRLSESTLETIEQAGLELDDIDLFVYHQANARILAAVGEKLEIERERVIDCIDRYGNTSSATLPIAMADARERGMLEPGMNVVLAAFGAGFTWGAGVIQWG